MANGQIWGADEIDILRTHYRKVGARGVKQFLPHRSARSIEIKASKLGVNAERGRFATWLVMSDRIQENISITPQGCWEWQGSLDPAGYGRMAFRGRNAKACRVAWCARHGCEWPEGMHALHSCDNRPCVNPEHIRPGTHAENMREAWERGGESRRARMKTKRRS